MVRSTPTGEIFRYRIVGPPGYSVTEIQDMADPDEPQTGFVGAAQPSCASQQTTGGQGFVRMAVCARLALPLDNKPRRMMETAAYPRIAKSTAGLR